MGDVKVNTERVGGGLTRESYRSTAYENHSKVGEGWSRPIDSGGTASEARQNLADRLAERDYGGGSSSSGK